MQISVQASKSVFTMLRHSTSSPQIYSVCIALPLLHRQVAVQSYAPQTGAAASRSAAQFWLQVDFLTPSSRCLSACLDQEIIREPARILCAMVMVVLVHAAQYGASGAACQYCIITQGPPYLIMPFALAECGVRKRRGRQPAAERRPPPPGQSRVHEHRANSE